MCDGNDGDCDGVVDNIAEEDKPLAMKRNGVCAGVRQSCVAGSGWQEPNYETLPGYEAPEQTCDGLDNDCNGQVDDGYDFQEDTNHCGGCGQVCAEIAPGTDACIEGQCRVACQDGSACGQDEICNTMEGYCIGIEQLYLKASNAGRDDYFGRSVAMDGNYLVVGAYGEGGDENSTMGSANNNAPEAGAAYVYERQADGTWQQTAYLKASNAGAGDNFGYSVALHGERLVVGTPYEDGDAESGSTVDSANDFASDAGAAYVYERHADGTWRQTAYLKASNAGRDDYFGFSVALDGERLLIGASSEDGDANSGSMVETSNEDAFNAGAAYVYERQADGTWLQTAYLKASNAGAQDSFGGNVALEGNRLLIGAHYENGDANSTMGSANNNTPGAGAAYVYERQADGTWRQTAYLKASNAGREDYFGISVALDGERLLIGAAGEAGNADSTMGSANDFASDAGAAYVYERQADGTWLQTAYLKASNAGAEDSFGVNVAMDNNYIAIGAQYEDGDENSTLEESNEDAFNAGAAYLYSF